MTGAFGLTLQQFREALDLIASGRVPAGQLVTHRFPLEQAMQAFALAETGQALKAVITPGA